MGGQQRQAGVGDHPDTHRAPWRTDNGADKQRRLGLARAPTAAAPAAPPRPAAAAGPKVWPATMGLISFFALSVFWQAFFSAAFAK
jgi:hypothetical protein